MARLLGKCLWKRAEVSPGHVVKKPELMAAVQINTKVLKDDQWRYWTMFDLVESGWLLFENRECGVMGETGD